MKFRWEDESTFGDEVNEGDLIGEGGDVSVSEFIAEFFPQYVDCCLSSAAFNAEPPNEVIVLSPNLSIEAGHGDLVNITRAIFERGRVGIR